MVMQRKRVLVALFAALSMAVPLHAASPFGYFDGIVGGGNGGTGVISLVGWALDDDGVAAVDVLVDGLAVGRSHYGRSRPGVTSAYPGYPDSALPGFAFELDSTHFLNGLHTVTARVRSQSGELVDLNSQVLEFTNVTHDLVPFGPIEFPNPDAELLGRCDDENPRRYAVVSGYALDVGVETGDMGVGYVELLIDGAIHKNSLLDCQFKLEKGGLSDCYGLRRLDVVRLFPNLRDAPHSGFRFVLDVGELVGPDGDYVPGRHVLTIRAGDISGQVADIDEIPVFFSCDDPIANEASFGSVGRPRAGLIYQGVIAAQGWALDREGVFRVRVNVDGAFVGNAVLGLPRPAVSSRYPGYPQSAAPGWQFNLDTTALSNGPHTMQALVEDTHGAVTMIGQRTFIVFNP
jgi:hypothetical protein